MAIATGQDQQQIIRPGGTIPYGTMRFADKRPDGRRWGYIDPGDRWERETEVGVWVCGAYVGLIVYRIKHSGFLADQFVVERAAAYLFDNVDDAVRAATEGLKHDLCRAPDDIVVNR